MTKDKHDFKGALEVYQLWVRDGDRFTQPKGELTKAEENLCNQGEAIQTALRIADRLQSGEVGEALVSRTRDKILSHDGFVCENNSGDPVMQMHIKIKEGFKAMAAKLIEMEEDDG